MKTCVVLVGLSIFMASALTPSLGQDKSVPTVVDPTKVYRVTQGLRTDLALNVSAPTSSVLRTESTRTRPLHVDLQRWSIDHTSGRQTIRTAEFTVFHLRTGKLNVSVNGKEEEKTIGDMWTSPAGGVLTFQVKGETAVVDAESVSGK